MSPWNPLQICAIAPTEPDVHRWEVIPNDGYQTSLRDFLHPVIQHKHSNNRLQFSPFANGAYESNPSLPSR